MKNMLRLNAVRGEEGFTLIELVMVIVILGLLAAVAIPKYVSLKTEAGDAAVDGVAAALGSTSAINLAVAPITGKATDVSDCNDLPALLEGGLPTGYSVTSAVIPDNGTTPCTVGDGTYTTTFVGHQVTAA